MYQTINILIILIFIISLIVKIKNPNSIKFRTKDYLSKLSELEKTELIPYIRGILFIGLAIPALIWIGQVSFESMFNKTDQTYSAIGYCYSNNECRHLIINAPIQTKEQRQALIKNQITPLLFKKLDDSQQVDLNNK
jgi:hypothetical protein